MIFHFFVEPKQSQAPFPPLPPPAPSSHLHPRSRIRSLLLIFPDRIGSMVAEFFIFEQKSPSPFRYLTVPQVNGVQCLRCIAPYCCHILLHETSSFLHSSPPHVANVHRLLFLSSRLFRSSFDTSHLTLYDQRFLNVSSQYSQSDCPTTFP